MTIIGSYGRLAMMRNGLGSIIRTRRKELDMTCKELAKRVGVDRSYIGKIENNSLIPAWHIIVKLEAVLGVKIQEFYLQEKVPYLDNSSLSKKVKIPRLKLKDIYLTKGKAPSYSLLGYDFAKPNPSGLLVGIKQPKYDKPSKSQAFNCILYFALHYQDRDPMTVAVSVAKRINPSKSNDRKLIAEIASTIQKLRDVYAKLPEGKR